MGGSWPTAYRLRRRRRNGKNWVVSGRTAFDERGREGRRFFSLYFAVFLDRRQAVEAIAIDRFASDTPF